MPDLAMCVDKKCSRKNSCYRFRAKPNGDWQVYGDFKETNEGCEFYIVMDEQRKENALPMAQIMKAIG